MNRISGAHDISGIIPNILNPDSASPGANAVSQVFSSNQPSLPPQTKACGDVSPSPLQRILDAVGSAAGNARNRVRRQPKWIAWVGGAMILTVTASVIASVSLADRASSSMLPATTSETGNQFRMRALSPREYVTEKAHAWRLYKDAKRKCVALGPKPQTSCLDQARTERKIRIAEAKAQFESSVPKKHAAAITLH